MARPRSTRQAIFAHNYCVELSNARINRFSDGFFPSTSHLWNSLPSSVFPASFNLPSFKRQVYHHLRGQMAWRFILKLILSYLPVHLISPSLYLPDTQIKHFSHSPSGKYPCCLSRTSGTNTRQCGRHPHLLVNSQSHAMAGECGEDGREHIRWTGKYDNISFRIKTPYWHTVSNLSI